jgi:hypothetical protein
MRQSRPFDELVWTGEWILLTFHKKKTEFMINLCFRIGSLLLNQAGSDKLTAEV